MRNRKTSSNMQKSMIKRPRAGWLVFFAVILLLFAAFIYGGIKAGQYAEYLSGGAEQITQEVLQ